MGGQEQPRKKPRRRWFQFAIADLLILTAGAAVVMFLWRLRDREPAPVEARFDFSTPGDEVEYVLDDESTIRELVLEPIKEATLDPRPAKYIIAGTLLVKFDDDTSQSHLLFLPFGRYRHNGEYYIADFTLLRTKIRENVSVRGL